MSLPCGKKFVSDSPGLVDYFWKLFEEINIM